MRTLLIQLWVQAVRWLPVVIESESVVVLLCLLLAGR
jgi:hypothetical protein